MIDKKIKDVANIIINNLLDELILSSQSANDKNIQKFTIHMTINNHFYKITLFL